MLVKKLYAKNFRNLAEQTAELSSGLNIFFGENAQGKTNLLETVVLCSLGKSMRNSDDKELIGWNKDQALVKVSFENRFGNHTAKVVLSRKGKKTVALDGIGLKKIGELLGNIPVVYFSPDEIKVIKMSPSERRRFLDIDLCQMDRSYFYTLTKYNKILNQRNTLLKKGGDELARTVTIWDDGLASEGAKIIVKRREFLKKLCPIAQQVHSRLTSGKETLDLQYVCTIDGETTAEIRQNFSQALAQSFPKDQRLHHTSVGCQRDDIKFCVNDVDIRTFGSQGQQRTTALSLKIAEAMLFEQLTGETPILLLDDVFSELDSARKNQLVAFSKKMQTIVTTTDLSDLTSVDYKLFTVKDGMVEEQ